MTDKKVSDLKHYLKTFGIRYTTIAKSLNLDNSTVAKYFKGDRGMSVKRYNDILSFLRYEANGDDLKLHLIDTWLSLDENVSQRKKLKNLSNKLNLICSELSDIVK